MNSRVDRNAFFCCSRNVVTGIMSHTMLTGISPPSLELLFCFYLRYCFSEKLF